MTRHFAGVLLRVIARVVPSRDREAWLQEWDAELAHQRQIRMRAALGSLFDAAWLRRQFTRDAEIVQDVRHGIRVLRSSPAFTVTATLVLALGIGATVGIFSVVDTLLVRRLPYVDAERVAMLWQGEPDDPNTREVALGRCYDWIERLRSFETLACGQPATFEYAAGPEPIVLPGAVVTDGFFRAIGASVMLGRTFVADDHLKGRDRVAILSHRFWRQMFGADPGAIGRTQRVTAGDYLIVGVLPPSFEPRLLQNSNQSYNDVGVYVPKVPNEAERRFRGQGSLNVVGRLRPGLTIAQAQSDLDRVSRDLAREYPLTDAGRAPRVQPLREHLAGNLSPALRLLVASVALVLLIASANVANLLLARASSRTRELALRSAIGAARGRLIRQLLTESLLLAAIGSVAGLGVAWATIRAIAALGPAAVPALASVSIDRRVILFATVLMFGVALVIGLVPALLTSRTRLVQALRGVAALESLTKRHALRSGIVVAEIALAVLLMAGATLLLRSFGALLSTDPGFNPDRVVALQVFAWDRNTAPGRRAAFVQDVLRRMQSDPRVTSVGAVSAMPFIEANINIAVPVIADRPLPSDDAGSTPAFLTFASPGYFPTLGVRVTSGRIFSDADRMDTRPVALVSEALARLAFGHRSPIGRHASFRWQGRVVQAEIVGVFADIRHDGLDQPVRSEVLVPHAQYGFGSMTFVARTAGKPADAVAGLKAHIRAVDPRRRFTARRRPTSSSLSRWPSVVSSCRSSARSPCSPVCSPLSGSTG